MAATNCSGTVDLETLCMAVEKHPLLYDPAHPDVRDFVKRAQAWKAISKVMNASPANCKKHWRSVRDRFVREERLAKQADVEDDRLAKWSLYRHLGFLVKSQRARLWNSSSDTYPGNETVVNGHVQPKYGQGVLPAQPSQPPLQLRPMPAAQNPEGYDVGSECVILHPDAITQSVLLSMVNVPSPDEIITPDQPPTTTMSCLENLTCCGTSPEPRQTPPIQTRITVKQEPPDCETLDQFEGQWEDQSARTSTTTSVQSRSAPLDTGLSRGKRKSSEAGIGRRSKYAKERRDSGDVASSTDALLRELTAATEQMKAMADATAQCRLQQRVDPDDCETMYLLSLRERLRKFGPREKSLALVRIQQVLHEIEFGTSG
ncbi:uncharacterized protein LOC144133545 isoform X2 [Amblyomma americanum]